MTKLNKNPQKRKHISKENALEILKDHYQELFVAYNEGLSKYNEEIQYTIPEARRRLEPALLHAKMTESFILHFPENYINGKYNRIIFRWDGIQMLIKKLDNQSKPLYLPTMLSDAIVNQEQMSLFKDGDVDEDAILFFGYTKTKEGELVHPRIVYYNQGVEWIADASDADTIDWAAGTKPQEPVVRLRKSGIKKAE